MRIGTALRTVLRGHVEPKLDADLRHHPASLGTTIPPNSLGSEA